MILTDCSSADAARAANAVCQEPEAVALLALACGASAYATAAGGMAFTATPGFPPAVIAAGAFSGAGMLGAKRFCKSIIDQTLEGVRKVDISLLQSHVSN